MIKYDSSSTGLIARVENIKTKERFTVSTAQNAYGVYETAVLRAVNPLISIINAFTGKALFIVNSSSLQQAEQNHIRTAELFEQLNPEDMIRKYKIEGKKGAQLFMTREDKDVKRSEVRKKEIWSHARLGQFIAGHFSKMVSDNTDLVFSSFKNKNKTELLKEWVFFNMFEMFQGINSYFKDSQQEGFCVLDHFHTSCSEIFTEKGIFDNPDVFLKTLLCRYKTYTEALEETKGPNPLYWLSKEFCQLCGDEGDIANNIAFATHYVNNSTLAKLDADLSVRAKILP